MTVKTEYDRACRKGRWPHEAKEVLEEIRDAVALLLRESDLEKAERLELMWNEIAQGNTTHAEFRAKWNAMLDDIDGELPQVKDPAIIYRRYLKAIKQDLQVAILKKDWGTKIPSGETQYRRPATWQELSDCCEDEVKRRIDTQSASEQINQAREGGVGLSPAAKKRAANKQRQKGIMQPERKPRN